MTVYARRSLCESGHKRRDARAEGEKKRMTGGEKGERGGRNPRREQLAGESNGEEEVEDDDDDENEYDAEDGSKLLQRAQELERPLRALEENCHIKLRATKGRPSSATDACERPKGHLYGAGYPT
ncbi:hypothetical protein FRC18_008475 [Serendipita sp. 400]|nr:hypothetical protein FRC18_008475 [Serendipita sp. 400]